jgi:hypothetical protein
VQFIGAAWAARHGKADLPCRVLHQTGLLALPIAVLRGCAFVVLLLAFGETDAQLRAPALPVHFQWHERVTAPLDGADEPVQLGAVEQQLARADRIGDDVRRCRGQ